MTSPSKQIVDDPDDDGSPIVGAPICVIPVEIVDAVCIGIQRTYFAPWQQWRWVFRFAVAFPEKYCREDLFMYARETPKLGQSSKLLKAAYIAAGNLKKGQRIQHSWFLHKMFRCRTRQVHPKDGLPYTVIDFIVEKLTG